MEHCFWNSYQSNEPADLVIRAGKWDLQVDDDEQFPFQEARVSKIVKHKKYRGGVLWNDVALIFLTNPFTITTTVGTICLPPRDFQFNNVENCYVSGWGKNKSGKRSRYLHWRKIRTLQYKYRETYIIYRI